MNKVNELISWLEIRLKVDEDELKKLKAVFHDKATENYTSALEWYISKMVRIEHESVLLKNVLSGTDKTEPNRELNLEKNIQNFKRVAMNYFVPSSTCQFSNAVHDIQHETLIRILNEIEQFKRSS